MKTIKETIITETNERGRVTHRIVSVETRESYEDYDYDMDTRRGMGRTHNGSFDRIWDAYKDYCKSREW